ncbi:MAG TPA: zinc-ribbon domain-containing protein, partial [Polyangiaceae bacterium]
MFKVECPGCKAPYQVDERRVPSSGLKMRCPKCGTSFKVEAPSDPHRTGPSPALGGTAESTVPPMAFGAQTAPAAAAAPAAPPRPRENKGTVLGVAPAGAGAAQPMAPAMPSAAARAHLKGT